MSFACGNVTSLIAAPLLRSTSMVASIVRSTSASRRSNKYPVGIPKRRPFNDAVSGSALTRAGGRQHGVVEQPRVGDRSGQRPHMIELAAERDHAGGGDLPPLRLQSHDAARGGGNADRSAGIGSDRAERHARRHGDRRTAARTSRRSSGIVGISRRAEARIFRGRAERELMKVGLADEHRAGLAQTACHRRVGRRHVILAHERPGRRGRAFAVDQILERERNAVQRSEVAAAGDFFVSLARARQRLIGGDGDERIQLRIELRDRRQAILGDLLGRDLPRRDLRRELSDGHHRVRLSDP